MRWTKLTLGLAAAVLAVGVIDAQATNLAGTWTLDWAKTDAANAALGGPGEPRGATLTLTVTEDAKMLTEQMEGYVPRTYRLDGSESTNTLRGGVQVARASWDGARLKIVIKGPNGDTTRVWTLEHGDLQITTIGPSVKGVTPASSALVFHKGS
jgi:hypothetical protein